MPTKEPITVRFDEATLKKIDQLVEETHVFESRAHVIRTGTLKLLDNPNVSDEFDQAR